jgi:hypothetical protein
MQITHQVTDRAVAGTGIAAAGASSAPTPIYGDFLTTHGMWILSYAEWIQVIGSIYVAFLLLKVTGVFSGLNKLYKWIMCK